MPGLVAFRRRWSVGSDDLVLPAVFLFIVHLSWLVVTITLLVTGGLSTQERCATLLRRLLYCYAAILGASCLLEAAIGLVSLRGGILEVEPRRNIKYIVYVRLSVMAVEMVWLSYAVYWLVSNYQVCPIEGAKEAALGMVACNWIVVGSVFLTGWCVFDSAGRSWVKMKKYQRSMRESESRFQYKRSGNLARNWRQRKVLRAYQDSWDHRCRLLFCCIRNSDRTKNSFTDIARLLSDFFRDLDVVPSDVVAGLVLLRKYQKLERETNVREHKNDTYEYLSGVAVTPRTKFLPLGDIRHYRHFEAVVHFMHYALAAYGWPMLLMTSPLTTYCKLCSNLSCLCRTHENVEGDNCWSCNYAALKGMLAQGQVAIVYATYHVDIAQTPFFVAVDYTRSKIVVSIRGTLSMKDVITDLNAESETLPLNPPKEDWLGHKGMVEAAVYIRDKLESEQILAAAAIQAEKGRPGESFGLVLVGHSLGAGTASILAILLRQNYPDLQCFAYSPPGGLLSMPAVQYTKSFITSVVLGKDVVPRIGLPQMESLRADLINAIKRSKEPKWKTIACSVVCCDGGDEADPETMVAYHNEKMNARDAAVHPSDSTIALTLHQPLYPPGSIIHVVRHHPSKADRVVKRRDPVYQAVWANNTDFDEVLISPVMIQDHMPDKVLEALNKVITSLGPAKPQRTTNENNNSSLIGPEMMEHDRLLAGSSNSKPRNEKVCFETSFTNCDTLPPSGGSLASLLYAANPSDYPSSPLGGEWCGLAPLAAPESLSDLSTIGPSVRFDDDVTRVSGSTESSMSQPLTEGRFFARFFRRHGKPCDRTISCPVDVMPTLSNQDKPSSSSESSPLLSSLHLLNDNKFLPNSISPSASFHSTDSALASPVSLATGSLLEDIERSLGVCLSRPASVDLPPGTPVLYPISDNYT
uniref:Diacylglycerol lipase-alpha n=1 Tax=Lygus hesperus TaxID=30085 RepID=A0A0A9W875_LYGHE